MKTVHPRTKLLSMAPRVRWIEGLSGSAIEDYVGTGIATLATPSDDRAEFNSQIPLDGNRHEAQATGATVIAGALLGVSPLALIKRKKKTPEAERERDDNTPEWDNPQTRTDGEAGDAGIDGRTRHSLSNDDVRD